MRKEIKTALEYSSYIEGQIENLETQLDVIISTINRGLMPTSKKSFNSIRHEIKNLRAMLQDVQQEAID